MIHGGLLVLEILEIFSAAFMLKTIIQTLISFKYCRLFSLKRKINLKKDTINVNTDGDSQNQKNKMRKNQRKTIFFYNTTQK